MIDLPNSKGFQNYQAPISQFSNQSKKIEETIPLEQLVAEFDSFEKLTFSNRFHRDELTEICPFWLYKQADSSDLDLFQAMTRFDDGSKTLITGCYETNDIDFNLISYKYRRLGKIKWCTRKSTHPNAFPFIRIFSNKEPIFIVEGHHDALTAILLGLDFIMLPTASFKNQDLFAEELNNREVVFIVEDSQAYYCMLTIAQQLTQHAKKIELIQLQKKQKMDLSDFCFLHRDIEEVQNGLRNYRQNTI